MAKRHSKKSKSRARNRQKPRRSSRTNKKRRPVTRKRRRKNRPGKAHGRKTQAAKRGNKKPRKPSKRSRKKVRLPCGKWKSGFADYVDPLPFRGIRDVVAIVEVRYSYPRKRPVIWHVPVKMGRMKNARASEITYAIAKKRFGQLGFGRPALVTSLLCVVAMQPAKQRKGRRIGEGRTNVE